MDHQQAIPISLSYDDVRKFDDRVRHIERGVSALLVLVASLVDETGDKAEAVKLAADVRASTKALADAIPKV